MKQRCNAALSIGILAFTLLGFAAVPVATAGTPSLHASFFGFALQPVDGDPPDELGFLSDQSIYPSSFDLALPPTHDNQTDQLGLPSDLSIDSSSPESLLLPNNDGHPTQDGQSRDLPFRSSSFDLALQPTLGSFTARVDSFPQQVAAGTPSSPTPGDPPLPTTRGDAHPVAEPADEVSSPSSTDDLCARPTGFKRFACDSRALGRRLLLREPGDKWRALGVLGMTGLLYAKRYDIHDYVMDHRSPSRTNVYDAARNLLAKGATSPIVASALYLTGKISKNSYHTESAQIVLESTLYAGLLAVTGQFVIASERPSVGDEVYFFRTNGHGVSGDVAIAASVVAPLDRRYLRAQPGNAATTRMLKAAGRAVLYAGVFLVAMQRMDADAHWAPDVFLGAAAGFTAGYSICSAHEPAGQPSPSARNDSRRPALVARADGLALLWSF